MQNSHPDTRLLHQQLIPFHSSHFHSLTMRQHVIWVVTSNELRALYSIYVDNWHFIVNLTVLAAFPLQIRELRRSPYPKSFIFRNWIFPYFSSPIRPAIYESNITRSVEIFWFLLNVWDNFNHYENCTETNFMILLPSQYPNLEGDKKSGWY